MAYDTQKGKITVRLPLVLIEKLHWKSEQLGVSMQRLVEDSIRRSVNMTAGKKQK